MNSFIRKTLGIALVLTLGLAAVMLRTPKISLSILGGGVMAAANFLLLVRLVQGFLDSAGTGKSRLVALFFLKLAALSAVMIILLKFPVHMLGFVGGLSTIIVAVVMAGLLPQPRT